jgi:hypothetical protein
MIPMISLQAHVYAGKRLNPGDKFECRGQSDARVLRALGRAIDYTAPPEPVHAPARTYTPPGTYSTAAVKPQWRADVTADAEPKDLEAEEPPQIGSDDHDAPKPKRDYRRRDMKAEE